MITDYGTFLVCMWTISDVCLIRMMPIFQIPDATVRILWFFFFQRLTPFWPYNGNLWREGGGLLFAILDWELTKHFLIEEKFKSQEDTIHKWVFKDHIFWGQENKNGESLWLKLALIWCQWSTAMQMCRRLASVYLEKPFVKRKWGMIRLYGVHKTK